MTATGDHGGDSFDELDATLFVYSSSVISDDISLQVCMLLQHPTPFAKQLCSIGKALRNVLNGLEWRGNSFFTRHCHLYI